VGFTVTVAYGEPQEESLPGSAHPAVEQRLHHQQREHEPGQEQDGPRAVPQRMDDLTGRPTQSATSRKISAQQALMKRTFGAIFTIISALAPPER
jgi:hypothetical protein